MQKGCKAKGVLNSGVEGTGGGGFRVGFFIFYFLQRHPKRFTNCRSCIQGRGVLRMGTIKQDFAKKDTCCKVVYERVK